MITRHCWEPISLSTVRHMVILLHSGHGRLLLKRYCFPHPPHPTPQKTWQTRFKKILFLLNNNVYNKKKKKNGGGVGLSVWVRQRYHVSYVTGAYNSYWLTVGQGLMSLQWVRVEGECFYFFFSFTFIQFPFSPVPLFPPLYYLFYLSSPFLWETTQNDPQGLIVIKPQLSQ